MREETRKPLLHMRNSIAPSAADEQLKKPKTDVDNLTPDTVEAPPAHTYDELIKMRRTAYIKMVAIVVLVVAVLAFGSMQATTIQMTV